MWYVNAKTLDNGPCAINADLIAYFSWSDIQEVVDNSGGCGQMFEVVIVSSLFKDKRTLARHRLVNDTLKDEISKVHAFSQVG
jgi:stress-induced morphogen